MNNIYVDYDKLNMIMTIKVFDCEDNISVEQIAFNEESLGFKKSESGNTLDNLDYYGHVIDSNKQKILNKINCCHIERVLEKIILVENEDTREHVKDILPHYYCLIIGKINDDFIDAIKIEELT